MKGFTSLIETAKETLVVLENPKKNLESAPTLVYWQDERLASTRLRRIGCS